MRTSLAVTPVSIWPALAASRLVTIPARAAKWVAALLPGVKSTGWLAEKAPPRPNMS